MLPFMHRLEVFTVAKYIAHRQIVFGRQTQYLMLMIKDNANAVMVISIKCILWVTEKFSQVVRLVSVRKRNYCNYKCTTSGTNITLSLCFSLSLRSG